MKFTQFFLCVVVVVAAAVAPSLWLPGFHEQHDVCVSGKRQPYALYSPAGLLPSKIRTVFPRGKPAATESRYPNRLCKLGVLVLPYIPPNSETDYRIFNVRKAVNARDYRRGCTDTVKEAILKR